MTGMEFANSPVVWIFASAIIVLVIFQAIKFLQLSKKAARGLGISETDIKEQSKLVVLLQSVRQSVLLSLRYP